MLKQSEKSIVKQYILKLIIDQFHWSKINESMEFYKRI
jgi:hypothetical protein